MWHAIFFVVPFVTQWGHPLSRRFSSTPLIAPIHRPRTAGAGEVLGARSRWGALVFGLIEWGEHDFWCQPEQGYRCLVTKSMMRYGKIRLAAIIMLAKYGKAAAAIARLRARQSARRHDEDAVKAWTAAVRAALRRSRKGNGDASLTDVLGGHVTRQVMAQPIASREGTLSD